MASRRGPLTENPNAANSPFRGHTATKRARSNTADVENEQSPPKKKHIIDASFNVSKPTLRSVFDDAAAVEKGTSRPPSSFQKRLLAERDSKPTSRPATQKPVPKAVEKVISNEGAADREALQNWKKHYRTAFPRFTFYFENIPPDNASRLSKQCLVLGARVEKFFSKDVTHVITLRSIPPAAAPTDIRTLPSRAASQRPDTIDPAVLNKGDATTRTRSGLESLHRRSNATTLDSRSNASNDVLYKARDMGKKIWTLEKFQRMLSTLFCHDGSDDDEQQSKRHVTSLLPSKREREADLSQLLRNERNNAPVDRKPWQEIISFRGVYVYVHDMDERTRPVMVREYQKPVRKEDGKWPMFRSVSKGRCPFVEELYPPPRDDDAEAKRRAAAAEQAKKVKPTRAAVKQKQAVLEQTIDPPVTRSATQSPKKEQQPLKELPDLANQMPKPQLPASLAKGDMPKLQRQASGSVGDMPPMLGSTNANYQGLSRKPGGEPLASGMRANITSAIQSQMYSSTAPSAPGQRVGMTRQQHQMSRRILERQSGLSNGNMPSSFSVTDVRAALNKDSAPATRRNTRLQTTDKLSKIHEDEDVSEETDAVDQARTEAKAVQPSRRRAPVKRDPKPGYCENCRDKYDDFYEHIASKVHRRFATSTENFADLDKLLKVLIRR